MTNTSLPQNRLATSDERGNRIYLYPADVAGVFRNRRHALNVILVLFLITLPWIRIRGEQALLLDIIHGKFAIFGLRFWAHDAPMLLFVLGSAITILALVTAIWGRIWCGWACPQTVFVDGIFRRIERWVEGNHRQRKALDEEAFTFNKLKLKSIKWILFTLLSLVISHSFLAYFFGVEALEKMIRSSPIENPIAFLIMLSATLFILFDFGWFREQFCTLVCPYGRFQSVLMDENSLVVAYDQARGEPRGGLAANKSGACVDCFRCVQVCPTGIDIRRGVQLECIACTACIDACNDVMKKIKKAPDLIRYGNQAVSEGRPEVLVPIYKRVRVWAYFGLLTICLSGLSYAVSTRSPIEVDLLRAVDSPYQEIAGPNGTPMVVNHFKIDLRNQTFSDQSITIALPDDLEKAGTTIVLANHNPFLASGNSERTDLFIKFPKSLLQAGHANIALNIQASDIKSQEKNKMMEQVHLVGPY